MLKINQLKFLLFVISITLSFTGFAQITVNPNDPNNAPFIGTWEHQNDNEIFRLILEEDTEPREFNKYSIIGHYEMMEVDANGQETLIYTSRPQHHFYPGTGQFKVPYSTFMVPIRFQVTSGNSMHMGC